MPCAAGNVKPEEETDIMKTKDPQMLRATYSTRRHDLRAQSAPKSGSGEEKSAMFAREL